VKNDMRTRILLVVLIVDTYEKHSKNPSMLETVLDYSASLLKEEDKAWFDDAHRHFKKSLDQKKSARQWIKDQLKAFNIFAADEKKQAEYQEDHCLSFVYYFLNADRDDYICDYKISLGDLIVYEGSDFGFNHIALFMGKFDGVNYAISKFGKGNEIFIHPVDHVPLIYGRPTFYASPKELTSQAKAAFAEFEKDVIAKCIKEQKAEMAAVKLTIDVDAAGGVKLKIGTPEFSSQPQTHLAQQSDIKKTR
jgi:hypothetical protein